MTTEIASRSVPSESAYDTLAGISKYLEDGLAGLHRLAADRDEAHYKRGELMAEWIVVGRWGFDTCGNMAKVACNPAFLPVESCPAGRLPSMDGSWSFSVVLPAPDAICPRCGRGWDLRTAHEAEIVRHDGPPFHTKCAEYELYEAAHAEFQGIFAQAGMSVVLKAIRNEYGSLWAGPWFLADAAIVVSGHSLGTFKIGWRKRVIEIDWSKTKIPEGADKLFDGEKVTVGATYIHAWSTDRAIDYLTRLRHAAWVATCRDDLAVTTTGCKVKGCKVIAGAHVHCRECKTPLPPGLAHKCAAPTRKA